MSQSPGVHRGRLETLVAAMQEQDVAALVVFGHGSALGPGTRSHGSLRYLSGFDGQHSVSALVVVPGRRTRLLVTNIFAFMARAETDPLPPGIPETVFVPAPGLGAEAARLCAEAAPAAGRIGIVGRPEMPLSVWEPLAAGLPDAQWVDLTGEIDRVRVVKTDEEIGRHERAAALCDALFDTLRREIREARPVFQLQAELERTARYAGSEYCRTWLTAAPEADYCRSAIEECRRVPEPGDQVLLGVYLMLDGVWGHAIRMGAIGPPRDEHVRLHSIVSAMQDAMQQRLRPGFDLGEVQRAADEVLGRALSDEERQRLFSFRHAHGLGYSYEDPIVTAPFPQPYAPSPEAPPLPAEPGMLFELHPNLFLPGIGGAALGDMVTVTGAASRRLTQFPRDLIDWSA